MRRWHCSSQRRHRDGTAGSRVFCVARGPRHPTPQSRPRAVELLGHAHASARKSTTERHMVGASLMSRFRERRFRFPLRYHLIALVVIALVPALIFAGMVVRSLGREQRESVERGLQATVRALAIAV